MYRFKVLDGQVLTNQIQERVNVRKLVDAIHWIAPPTAIIGKVRTIKTNHVIYFLS
jgi:hypothetical protein